MNNLKHYFFILLTFVVASVHAETFNFEKDCSQGKCLPDLIKEAEELTKKAQNDKCLPPSNSSQEQIDNFYKGKEISEACIGMLEAIKVINDKIILVQSILEGSNGDLTSLQCKADSNPNPELAPTLLQLAEHQERQCTEDKIKQVQESCSDDLMCSLVSSSTTIAGPILKYFNLHERLQASLPQGCDLVGDNCIAQFALGFLSAAKSFFVGVKDLVVMGWKALWGLEEKTSSSQLALAEASEDPGVFQALVDDFPGSMKKLWQGFTTLLKEWMTNDVFCQKWEGVPHHSKCLEPFEGFACLSCKNYVNALCSLSGNIIAEIVPAFVTGGAVAVIKHGANATVKLAELAKTLKVSKGLYTAVQKSGIDKLVKAGATAGRMSITALRGLASSYLKSPMHKGTIEAFKRINAYLEKGAVGFVVNGGKRTLILGGKTVAAPIKLGWWLMDNKLTRSSFELGGKLVDLPFKASAIKLTGGVRAATLTPKAEAAMSKIDDVGSEMVQLEVRLSAPRKLNSTPAEMQSLLDDARRYEVVRADYLKVVAEKRAAVLDDLFTKNPDKIKIQEVIDDLYPELKYDQEFVKALQRSKIAEAEADLLARIKKIEDPALREKLIVEFNDWRSRPSRSALKIDQRRFFHSGEILKNADMEPNDRFLEALRLTGRKTNELKPDELVQLRDGLLRAHEVGSQRGAKVFSYTADEIREKAKILKEAGYSSDDIDTLMRSGLAGRGFREVIPARGVAYQAANGISADEFLAFKQLHKGSIDELLKGRKIDPEMLKAENMVWAHNPDSGVRYLVLKDPENIVNSYVFSLEKSRWNPFAKPQYGRIRDLPKEFGDFIRLSDGQAIKVGSRDAARKGAAQFVDVIEDTTKSTYRQHIDDLIGKTDDLNFKNFLSENAEEIERLMKTGRYTVSDIVPENFMILKPIGSDESFTLLRSNQSFEARILNKSKPSEDIGDILEKIKEPLLYERSNGNLVRVSRSSFGIQVEEFPAKITAQQSANIISKIEESVIRASNKTNLANLKPFKAQLDFDLRTGRLSADELMKSEYTMTKLSNGQEILVMRKPGPSGHYLEYYSPNGQNVARIGSLDEISDALGNQIIFPNGKIYNKWKFGNSVFFDEARNASELIGSKIDDTVRRYSVVDSKGNEIFADQLDFYRKHRDELIKAFQRGERVELGFRNIAKAVTADGDSIFMSMSKRMSDESIVFTDKGTKKLKDVLVDDQLILNDGRVISRSSDGTYSFTDSAQSLKNKELQAAFNNAKVGLDHRLDVFEAKYVKPQGLTLNADMKSKILRSLEETLQYSANKGVGAYQYSPLDLRKVKAIFKSHGVPDEYANYLIRSGLAARPPNSVLSIVNEARSPYSSMAFEQKRKTFLRNLDGELAAHLRADPSKIAKYTPEEIAKIQDNFDAMYFIDYQHHSADLLKLSRGEVKLSKIDVASTYNKPGQKPFDNYKATMQWLRHENPPLNTTTMKKIHVKMMEGGIEDLRPEMMGVVRPYDVYGNASRGISREALESLRDNHYVSFLQTGTTPDGLITGKIWYPNIEVVSDKTLDLIKTSHPDVYDFIRNKRLLNDELLNVSDDLAKLSTEDFNLRKLIESTKERIDVLKNGPNTPSKMEELVALQNDLAAHELRLKNLPQELGQKQALLQQKMRDIQDKIAASTGQNKVMQQKLLDALTEDALQRFSKRRESLGIIDTPEKFDQYVDMLAELQREMVSIHPLGNGNGRTTRQFALYYPLMKEGFPPPRILDTNNDLYKPLAEWSREIKEGIKNSQKLLDDLEYRTRLGLKIEDSPYLLTPKSPPETIELTYKIQGKNDVLTQVERVDPEMFHHYRMQVIQGDDKLKGLVESGRAPTQAWDEIDTKAAELYKRDHLFFDHQKKGLERIGLGPVTKEFKEAYGRTVATDPMLYQRKMDQFFDDQVVWRGLASKNHVKSEEELINFFRQTNNHMASNSILSKRLSSAEDIRKAGLEDLEKYRRSLEVDGDEGIVRMAKDHSETGPMYGQSWGYSTSKDRKVGKAFAQGAMVVAPYGQHQKFQHLLKQRVLVGGRKAKTDVDLSRLKNLRNEFSYKYPRQQEVMGVGAMDPDAIQVVQTLDEAGKASRTYLRNPERPYEVLVIKGEVNPGDKIPRELIERVVDLRN